MAKRNETGTLFPSQTIVLPEGYYSGDKPNPNLRTIVEAHLHERPYDPETDHYKAAAFSQPINTTKATAIYNMHTYWSKKPHDAIRQYIRHYTRPGDLVLDPFCGSGGTASGCADGRPQSHRYRPQPGRHVHHSDPLHAGQCGRTSGRLR